MARNKSNWQGKGTQKASTSKQTIQSPELPQSDPRKKPWLTAQFKGKNPKSILLPNHQLFSAYENTNADNLKSRVQPFLNANQIYGWIWGHEHLCVVYEEHLGIKAVCLGNGCFPYNSPTGQRQVPVEWMNTRAQQSDPDYRGIHTFALLKISAKI